jgi:hypothetical protein
VDGALAAVRPRLVVWGDVVLPRHRQVFLFRIFLFHFFSFRLVLLPFSGFQQKLGRHFSGRQIGSDQQNGDYFQVDVFEQ